jgi:hypothetical protein
MADWKIIIFLVIILSPLGYLQQNQGSIITYFGGD